MLRVRSLSHHLSGCLRFLKCHTPAAQSVGLVHIRYRHASAGSTEQSQTVDAVPQQARVVICGGGIAGLSAAYNLAKLGLTDVVLLEQGSFTCGTTWHAAGLVGLIRKHNLVFALSKMSANLYETLEEETGLSTGYRKTGSVMLAQTKDRMIDLKRNAALAKTRNIDHTLLAPSEVNSIVPWVRTDDLVGALHVHGDGITDPTNTALSLARGAKNRGVQLLEGVQVKGVLSENGKVSQVQTSLGDIKCEYFVNAAGQWGRDVGLMSQPEVNVPVHSTAHGYLITKSLPGLDVKTPYVRDVDSYNYIREWSGGLMCGMFAPNAKPIFHEGIPEKSAFISLAEDWDHIQYHLDGFLHRVPVAEKMEVRQLFVGAECFTPDLLFLFGEVAEMRNYYLMTGFNSLGITMSGGLGQLLAELIVHGETSLGHWPVNPQRFSPLQNNKAYLRDRVTEIEGTNYKLMYPHNQYKTGRKLRCTPLYARLAQAGAVFGEMMGVERPKWYMEEGDTEEFVEDVQRGTFGKPGWFDMVKAEYWACRESVCVMDMSSFTKFELEGKSATSLLQHLCANDMDVPIGAVVHTGMLNERGGYENDCSVARLDEDRYFLICPTIQQVKGYHWIARHLPKDGSVKLQDVTSQYTGLNVLGPKARDVLQKLTSTPLSAASFKPFCHKEINLGFTTGIHAMTITHAGEDGMLLYIPNEGAVHVYDMLMKAGRDYGIRPAGYHALRWLRIEKCYAYWGVDFNNEHTPFEIGREMRVKFNKGIEFIGQSALLRQQEEGIHRRLTAFILEDHKVDRDLWCWGGEPIYRNGQPAGMTTSSSFSPTLGSMLCLGWLSNTDRQTGQTHEVTHDYVTKAKYEIDVAGHMFPAKANLYPPKLVTKQPLHG
ncbi:LOW QUALITY PROTEIN: pyruvate dehydrogenase phosphatase regulatory subunit, mitochondrial-like [Acanthaster planci]|uniref:LOW QUALITY PROTEIN: pyruvate dehydrogenase phosphatase regulatory subunit, mitochondrial-like n=1 Tax=Acanthaster planci TaxID=133434 RepID=A0A8B7ZHI0_ACAPL|nr:LOW QUALITY PROTEIN: pyruvate dehydrogenase phosphatase regulatory subunit, mitochondrial-like [Acanthaster planci]